eukprot:COSAG06_NODE_57775_length_279_cov_0.688889_1_plen_72_part_00
MACDRDGVREVPSDVASRCADEDGLEEMTADELRKHIAARGNMHMLPAACCLLPAACCLLPTAYCCLLALD